MTGFWSSVAHAIFGARVDSGWGIAASIYVSVVAITFIIAGYRSVHEFFKAADIRFRESTLDNYNLKRPPGTPPRSIDWLKARKQQVQSWCFTIPFGVLTFVVLYLWVRNSFTIYGYFVLAVLWLIFQLVLRAWWIATAVWSEKNLVNSGVIPAERSKLHNVSVGWAIRHYLNWGLQRSTVKRPPYIGLFRVFNPFIRLFGLRWLQLRLIRPLVVCAFFACTWPVSMVVATFRLTYRLHERGSNLLKPFWASALAQEPTYGSGAIPDSLGDAHAAMG